jgi:hypothetical protein
VPAQDAKTRRESREREKSRPSEIQLVQCSWTCLNWFGSRGRVLKLDGPLPSLSLQVLMVMLSTYHAITRQPRRIAALSVGCGLVAVGLATRWETRTAFRSITTSRQHILSLCARVTHTSYSVPVLRTAIRFFSTTSPLSSIFDISSLSSSNMANLTPPQPPPVWTHTPEVVLTLTKEAINKDREVQDRVAKLPPSECNFDTVSPTIIHSVAISAHPYRRSL